MTATMSPAMRGGKPGNASSSGQYSPLTGSTKAAVGRPSCRIVASFIAIPLLYRL